VTSVPDTECLPPEVVEWLQRKFQPKVGRYSISSLVGCPACSYDYYTSDKVEPIKELWKKKRGILLHRGLTNAFSWRELRISRTFEFENETLTIVAKLDTFVPERQVLYDFKTTDELDWQVSRGYLPRPHDILQLQCYWTLFKQYIHITDLKLIYLDKTRCETYSVPPKDTLDWLILRAKVLHQGLKSRTRPPSDPDCWLCSKSSQTGGSS
jgi:hypothetical protein